MTRPLHTKYNPFERERRRVQAQHERIETYCHSRGQRVSFDVPPLQLGKGSLSFIPCLLALIILFGQIPFAIYVVQFPLMVMNIYLSAFSFFAANFLICYALFALSLLIAAKNHDYHLFSGISADIATTVLTSKSIVLLIALLILLAEVVMAAMAWIRGMV